MEDVFDQNKNKKIKLFWNVEKYVISFIWSDLGWPCKVKLNTVGLPVVPFNIKGSVAVHSL